ncbi:hypothetical protein V3W47_16620 [Deinococcus sp. YIM 134068]|uniref:hypothetical protein n=1 Tax=Deinococcus lichenicola TaxID=3118910 RepID=UPI002F95BBDB
MLLVVCWWVGVAAGQVSVSDPKEWSEYSSKPVPLTLYNAGQPTTVEVRLSGAGIDDQTRLVSLNVKSGTTLHEVDLANLGVNNETFPDSTPQGWKLTGALTVGSGANGVVVPVTLYHERYRLTASRWLWAFPLLATLGVMGFVLVALRSSVGKRMKEVEFKADAMWISNFTVIATLFTGVSGVAVLDGPNSVLVPVLAAVFAACAGVGPLFYRLSLNRVLPDGGGEKAVGRVGGFLLASAFTLFGSFGGLYLLYFLLARLSADQWGTAVPWPAIIGLGTGAVAVLVSWFAVLTLVETVKANIISPAQVVALQVARQPHLL